MADNFYLDNPDLRFRIENADLGFVVGLKGARVFLRGLAWERTLGANRACGAKCAFGAKRCAFRAARLRRRPGQLAPRPRDSRRYLRQRDRAARRRGRRGGRELLERPGHLRQGDAGRDRGLPQVRDPRLHAPLGVRRAQPPRDGLPGDDRDGVPGRGRPDDYLRSAGDRLHGQRVRRRRAQGADPAALRPRRSLRRDGPHRTRRGLGPRLGPVSRKPRRGDR